MCLNLKRRISYTFGYGLNHATSTNSQGSFTFMKMSSNATSMTYPTNMTAVERAAYLRNLILVIARKMNAPGCQIMVEDDPTDPKIQRTFLVITDQDKKMERFEYEEDHIVEELTAIANTILAR